MPSEFLLMINLPSESKRLLNTYLFRVALADTVAHYRDFCLCAYVHCAVYKYTYLFTYY